MITSRTRRMLGWALAVAITALCLAACGSSSSSSTGSGSSGSGGSSSSTTTAAGGHSGLDRSKLAACLKAHGVTLPQRPAGSGSGAGGTPPAGANGSGATHRGYFFGGGGGAGRGQFANPNFRAAIQACGGGRFGGAQGRHFAFNHAAVTKFVACVKQHGYSLPAPNFSGTGPIFPRSIENNTKFQAAAKACASDLRPAGAPRPGGPPPGSD